MFLDFFPPLTHFPLVKKNKGYKSLSVFVRALLSFVHYDSSIPELSEKQRQINLKLNNTCKARGRTHHCSCM